MLTVSIIQTNLLWEDVEGNLKLFDREIDVLPVTDLIVLPEMFATGFSMNTVLLAQTENGRIASWMREKSEQTNAVVIGSVIIEDDGKYFNRLYAAYPDGNLKKYDKRHLFRMGLENQFFSAGMERLFIDVEGWRIMPLVCYDLRFPVWARNQNEYDLLIYIANWPASRRKQWKTLLKARAIENQVYLLAVNRIGTDGNDIQYTGDSRIISPIGENIVKAPKNKQYTETVTLRKEKLNDYRKNFPVLEDADNFTIHFDEWM